MRVSIPAIGLIASILAAPHAALAQGAQAGHTAQGRPCTLSTPGCTPNAAPTSAASVGTAVPAATPVATGATPAAATTTPATTTAPAAATQTQASTTPPTQWSPQPGIAPPWNAGYQKTRLHPVVTPHPDHDVTPSIVTEGVTEAFYDHRIVEDGGRTRVVLSGMEY